MRTLRLSLAGTVILALLGGLSGAVLAQSEESEAVAFPTGTFEADAGGESVEFNADGTCRWFSSSWSVPCTYAVNGDLYTEMAFDYPSGPYVPATYYWDYDGETLSFELWGEDPNASRHASYANHSFRPVGETLPRSAPETGFPTGTFVSVEDPGLSLEFNEDGTAVTSSLTGGWEVRWTYGVSGDLWAEMTFEYPGGPQVPATYYWDYDGDQLTFEVWGEDLRPHRESVYAGNTWRPVEDPRTVVVAHRDLEAGEPVWANRGIVPAAVAGPDVYTSLGDLAGRVAAVPISKGQPITPDLLEPAE